MIKGLNGPKESKMGKTDWRGKIGAMTADKTL